MNIALTYSCNQNCCYCFGKDIMSQYRKNSAVNFLNMENLEKVLNFMKRSSLTDFRMIGGEPTLHPFFKKIYYRIVQEKLNVMLFSNGVIEKSIVNFLSKQNNLSCILLNIREPDEYKSSDWQKIMYTLSALQKKVILSFRIYKIDFDPCFLFELIDRYSLKRVINWAIACPSLGHKNVFLPLSKHKMAVDRMISFSLESQSRKISWITDSGFIWCAFSDGRAEILKERTGFVPDTNCYPPLEVTPDLRVVRCFGMSAKCDKNIYLTDFLNHRQAEEYFFKKSLPLKRIGALDKCFNCEHLKSSRCGGGCMVHILRSIKNYKRLPNIF